MADVIWLSRHLQAVASGLHLSFISSLQEWRRELEEWLDIPALPCNTNEHPSDI